MASECIYYAWKYGGYYCNLANKEVDDDTVHRFCWTYYSDECPLRKNQSSSGCYITSACVRARGLPDDCLEMETLRAFRDGYLASQPGGREDIEEYYAKAPQQGGEHLRKDLFGDGSAVRKADSGTAS